MSFTPNIIIIKVMCVIEHGGRILVGPGFDKIKNESFYRLPGGSMEFGETSEKAIRREMREELRCELTNLIRLGIEENVFEYNGSKGHQIVFLFRAELEDKSIYDREKVHIVEPYGEYDMAWISIADILNKSKILYPSCNWNLYLSNHPDAFGSGLRPKRRS